MYACTVYAAFLLWNSITAHSEALRAGVAGSILAFPLLRLRTFLTKRKQHYLGSVRICFSEEGLHAQYPARQSRWRWSQFIGYLEDDAVVLLYLNPKAYSIIPKRALTGPDTRFPSLLTAKLPRYDYRNPLIHAEPKPAIPNQ